MLIQNDSVDHLLLGSHAKIFLSHQQEVDKALQNDEQSQFVDLIQKPIPEDLSGVNMESIFKVLVYILYLIQ